ncbi:hypothetical protein [Herbiconiux sp. VKM Ac-2851]|uniref:hypothetical protein n=1 Tax=Herbiconiux sp. VKM Ac-2851 TaxID=2739025 RepID=UPI00156502DB|nr:hypothetical protein [Herbiconiux sp. VKM Ac-2851]NQX34907.1 hypothetical protein [Herbiconiux sp. VKM Ac-2851]
MTTPSPQRTGRRRSVDRAQVGAAALAGLIDGCALAVLVAGFSWWSIGGWDEAEQSVGGWLVLALAVVVLSGAWFAGTALLRRGGLRRARSVVSWSLALSTVLVAVLTVVAGWVAVMIGMFSALVIWSGEYVDDIAVTAVVLVSATGVLLSTAISVLFAVAFADIEPTEGSGVEGRTP